RHGTEKKLQPLSVAGGYATAIVIGAEINGLSADAAVLEVCVTHDFSLPYPSAESLAFCVTPAGATLNGMTTRLPVSARRAGGDYTKYPGDLESATVQSSPASGVDASAGLKQCPACLSRFPVTFKVCPHDASALEDADVDDDPVLG